MHTSVLLNETIENLNLKENSIIVDCTLGYGGHSSEILKKIKHGYLYAFDQDINAIEYSKKRLEKIGSNFEIIKTNFKNLEQEINKRTDKVDGILYDLGVSSPQLDNSDRGFSFHKDAHLDMRMDLDSSFTAYDLVNTYSKEKLTDILYKYGDEKYASRIAKAIVEARSIKPIETTLELVDIIKNNVPLKYMREKHPARKTFQAIRIEVNHELEVLETSLKDALKLIKVGGRVAVITFHSLEDRVCQNIFKSVSTLDENLKHMPFVPNELQPKYKIIGKIKPSKQEIDINNRSRSATLRIIERVR